MKTRSYKEIINDIRVFSSENSGLSEKSKEQLTKYADELENNTKEGRFGLFLLFILLVLFVGSTAMWFLSSIEIDDLKIDNRNKGYLIERYERIIKFENDSTHSFSYRIKDGKPITYQELIDENFELMQKNADLEYEIKKRDIYLDVIGNNYGVRVIERNNHIWAESPKVDSAMILLNVYRDKIKYDPQTKTWSVGRKD